jgi:hypothetical protein
MVDNIIKSLAGSTPALRQRYLERIRSVPGEEARRLEERISALVARDKQGYAA